MHVPYGMDDDCVTKYHKRDMGVGKKVGQYCEHYLT